MKKKVETKKIDELIDLKRLLKEMKKSDSDLTINKENCQAITSYIEDLENRIAQLEKDTSDLDKKSIPVYPTRDKMGYYPVCPKCGRDLGDRIGKRYCDCGSLLSWINV